jgi:hypothetical protein
MQRYILALLLLYALTPCRAQAPPATTQLEITGTVVDAITGQPIPRACVTSGYETSNRSLTFTDTSGRFALTVKAFKRVSFNVSRQGYQRGDHSEVLKEGAAAEKPDITIKLAPSGVIHGRLVNADGEPLPDLSVELLKVWVLHGTRRLNVQVSRRSDDLGEYRFWDLAPGDYFLKTTGRGDRYVQFQGAPPLHNAEETFGTLFYPGAQTREQAGIIHLSPGATVRADLTMEAQRAFRIRGRLLNCASYPDARINLLRGDDEMGNRIRIDLARGDFEVMDVPAGAYRLQAWERAGSIEKSGEETVVVTDRDVSKVTVTLNAGVAVTGAIRYQGGPPTPPARWQSVFLLPVVASRVELDHQGASAEVAADNSFEVLNLLPGRYHVLMIHASGCYVHSITSGTTDVLAEGLTVVAGISPPPLEVVMQRGGGMIEGTVTVPSNGDRGRVVLVRRGGEAAIQEPAYSRPDGTFKVSDLAPGEYTAYAWTGSTELEYRNPAVLERVSKYATTVTVRDGGTEKITLRAIPKEEL